MDWGTPFILGLLAGLLGGRVWLRGRDARLADTLRRMADEPPDTAARAELRGPLADAAAGLAQRMERLERQLDTLQERSDLLVTVLRTMMEGVVVLDARQRVLFVNDAAQRLLELPPERLTGRLLLEVVRSPAIGRAVERVLREATTVGDVEFEMPRSKRRLLLQAVPLPGRTPQGLLLVFHDVTELRRLERIRREFVSNVSHELKTPLSSIQAYAETLLDGALEDPAHNRRFVERIASEAERLHALIRDLLELNRIETRQAESARREPVDLAAIVRERLAGHAAVADRRRIRLQSAAGLPDADRTPQPPLRPLEDTPVWILARRSEIRTLLDNLVDNALKYTPPGGHVTVRLARERGHAVISVQDTGCGIPEEHLPRIFERFYRVDRARSFDDGSTGLGLAIVKHIVQSFDGTIEVQSTVGQGSTFLVRLPLATGSSNGGRERSEERERHPLPESEVT